MSRMTRACRALAVGIAVAAATVVAAPLAHAGPDGPDLPAEAANIVVPAGNKVFLVGHATGVQIYRCTSSGWVFVAPRADLVGDAGQLVTTHFAGPTWQAKDGSAVTGSVLQRATVSSNAIPWLLLKATLKEGGPSDGRLDATTFIQRVATTDGLSPAAADCTATNVGQVREAPYTADYYFWKAFPGSA